MKLDLTDDKRFLICTSDFPYEMTVIKKRLTREIKNAWIIKKKMPWLPTEMHFINDYNMVPVGLWLPLMRFAKEANITCDMTPKLSEYLNSFNLDYEEFKKYIDELFDGAVNEDGKPFVPRQYQIEAAYTLLKYRYACGEISTSGGKTLISYMIFKYIIDKTPNRHILYIVPSVDLATQSADKYILYESYLKKKSETPWTVGILKAGLNKKEREAVEDCTILFGTFQSLCKRDAEFFSKFGACVTDECVTGDTMVSMADGSRRRIDSIVAGDEVITYNTDTNLAETHQVQYVHKGLSVNNDLYELTMADGHTLRITANHKVLLKDGRWVRVDELKKNDDIVTNSL